MRRVRLRPPAPRTLLSRILPLAFVLAALCPAGQAAAPRLQVYFASDFKDEAYQKTVYGKVASSWKRPAESPKPGGKAVVIARIRRDGTAPDTTLHLASGSEAWDAAALQAVKKAAPFGPLPKSYGRPEVEVHFHFEYD